MSDRISLVKFVGKGVPGCTLFRRQGSTVRGHQPCCYCKTGEIAPNHVAYLIQDASGRDVSIFCPCPADEDIVEDLVAQIIDRYATDGETIHYGDDGFGWMFIEYGITIRGLR